MIELITDNDLDAVACIALAKMAFGNKNVKASRCGVAAIDSTVLARLNVNDPKYKENSKFTEFHIADLRVSEEVATKIDKSDKVFRLFDHHEASSALRQYDWCTIATTNENGILTRAAEIYYNWLLNEGFLQRTDALDRFVSIVRDYDTWRWVELGEEGLISRDVNSLLYIYGPLEFYHWAIRKIENGNFPDLNADDLTALDEREREIDEYVQERQKMAIVSDFNDMKVAFVFAHKYYNELGHSICEYHPEVDFVAMINPKGRVSYRTEKENLNLNNIVTKHFGGGGHRQAAGSEFTDKLKRFVHEIGLVA